VITHEEHLRKLADSIPEKIWKQGGEGKDSHWLRAVISTRKSTLPGKEYPVQIAWCGQHPIEDAHALAAYIAAVDPETVVKLLDEISHLRSEVEATRVDWDRERLTEALAMAGLREKLHNEEVKTAKLEAELLLEHSSYLEAAEDCRTFREEIDQLRAEIKAEKENTQKAVDLAIELNNSNHR
jgi:hypothetical protein